MKDVAIYGAGGLGREMALLIRQINEANEQWNLLGFFDDGKARDVKVDELPVLGGIHELNAFQSPCSLLLAIADSTDRSTIVKHISNRWIDFPVIIHPRAILGSVTNKFGAGSIITAGCILTTGIVLGEFTILNLACTVGHDVKIGNYCSIMPGCNLSGNVVVGDRTLIGTGTQVLQNINVGKDCKVGAGAVVVRDISDGLTIVGVPAKRLI